MNQLPDTYGLASDAQALIARLIAHERNPVAEAQGRIERLFRILDDARILCVHCERQVMLRGWPVQAFIAEPRVQGPFSALFDWMLATLAAPLFETEPPDFVIVIDATTWRGLSDVGRERLLYHELQHVDVRLDEYGIEKRDPDDGRLKLRLRPHHHEFFTEEVLRYGPEVCQVTEAGLAIAEGYRREERRRGKAS